MQHTPPERESGATGLSHQQTTIRIKLINHRTIELVKNHCEYSLKKSLLTRFLAHNTVRKEKRMLEQIPMHLNDRFEEM